MSNRANADRLPSGRELFKVIEVVDSEAWNNLVRISDAVTIFHITSWQDCSPHAFIRFGTYQGDRLHAGALVEVNEFGADK
ncbi:MAG TPA: hypothetical protein VFH91_07825 [Pyrinomonadaceae bacterium]|nr:hypothetical protein [Pyrinomonadaceae bacterium]